MSQPAFRDWIAEAMAFRDAVTNMVARYTVALVSETGPQMGSGVLVSHGSDLFVATAHHLSGALDFSNLRCIPKAPSPVHIIEHRDQRYQNLPRPDLAPAVAFRLPVGEALKDGVADVALLRLTARPAEFNNMDFYPLERARSAELPHDRVVVCGFPFDLTLVYRPTGQGAVFSRTLFGTVTTVARENFHPDRDLLISYEDEGRVMDGHGMSGGGVWMPPRPGGTLWNPDEQVLIGVQVGCFEKTPGRPLVATRIERVTRLLA